MQHIGDRIKHIRKINSKTQIEFSSIVGIAQGTLSEIEAGRARPPIDMIYEIKRHFEIDLDWIIMGNLASELNHSTEIELIHKFRELSSTTRNEVMEFIEFKWLREKSNY